MEYERWMNITRYGEVCFYNFNLSEINLDFYIYQFDRNMTCALLFHCLHYFVVQQFKLLYNLFEIINIYV